MVLRILQQNASLRKELKDDVSELKAAVHHSDTTAHFPSPALFPSPGFAKASVGRHDAPAAACGAPGPKGLTSTLHDGLRMAAASGRAAAGETQAESKATLATVDARVKGMFA